MGYFGTMRSVLSIKVHSTLEGSDLSNNFHPKHVGSNHGLCGGFNKCLPENNDSNERVHKTMAKMDFGL